MSEPDRRQFFRVFFESTIEVRTNDWSDKAATGLDISLNGCRFNCKQSMSDGEKVSIVFKPGLELHGTVRWCWPIEWYYQAAVHFEGINEKEQGPLKTYIEEVTGENYQMEAEKVTKPATVTESDESLVEDLDVIDIDQDLSEMILEEDDQEEDLASEVEEDQLEELPPLEEEDLLNLDIEEPIDSVSDFSETMQAEDFFHELAEGDLNPLSFAGKQVVIFDLIKDQAELLNQYLTERAGMEVEYVTQRENLWRLLKIDPLDLVIIEAGSGGNSDALEVMQQTKDQFPEVHFICISGPVSLERRLQFLNAGALDYLTRPLHLSTIAQSVLVNLSRTEVGDFGEDHTPLATEAIDIPDEEPIADSAELYPDEDLSGTVNLLDEDLNLSKEVDLIDEDY